MKKSLVNTLGAIGIMALIVINVYVVTSKETPAFLKWDAMSYIFANGTFNGQFEIITISKFKRF